ncbi:hypothetical protein PM082_015518 [Marasmius tenuissimus]|nr:hypothetical protein PM082_015518 [Marasmius tenuissimus]
MKAGKKRKRKGKEKLYPRSRGRTESSEFSIYAGGCITSGSGVSRTRATSAAEITDALICTMNTSKH